VSSGRENVIQEERPRTYPLTTTEGREGLNAGIPEKTSTAPDQAVAAVNLGEQGPSSVSESVSHPDATTVQHIVDDVVSSGRENVIQEERPRTYPSTSTEGRERLNAAIPESKALFVVWKSE